jgi:hypothetical protein
MSYEEQHGLARRMRRGNLVAMLTAVLVYSV